MKVGDKVYCKKSNVYFDYVINKKGTIYTVIEISSNTVTLSCEESFSLDTWSYIFGKGGYEIYRVFLFPEHFYTIKEYRKLKLEKINESQNR